MMYEIDCSVFPREVSDDVLHELNHSLTREQEHYINVSKFSQLIIINGDHEEVYNELSKEVKEKLETKIELLKEEGEISTGEYKDYLNEDITTRCID